MSLRAVVFDYGMVLTALPDAGAHDAMVRLTGLSVERFEELYWADRHAYDEGKLSGTAFWQQLACDGNLSLSHEQIDQLNMLDARMWTTENPAMLAWQRRLKQDGILTGILSNMGDTVLENIEREFKWIHDFDVLVWSYQLHMAKPDPAIYLHILAKLGTAPEETLFLDDKLINVEAALALGIKSIQFSNVDKLREDLSAAGYDEWLALP